MQASWRQRFPSRERERGCTPLPTEIFRHARERDRAVERWRKRKERDEKRGSGWEGGVFLLFSLARTGEERESGERGTERKRRERVLLTMEEFLSRGDVRREKDKGRERKGERER